jgi:hypothetical protein
MLEGEMVHQDFRSIEGGFTCLADCEKELSVLLAVGEQARAALENAQEDAAIAAQDVLSQAEEALVMG